MKKKTREPKVPVFFWYYKSNGSEEFKNAEDDTYKRINSHKRADDRENNADDRNACEESDYDTCDRHNYEKYNELNNERNDVSFFDLEGRGPNFLKKIHNYYLSILCSTYIIMFLLEKCNSIVKKILKNMKFVDNFGNI